MEYEEGTIPPTATPADLDSFVLSGLTAATAVALTVNGTELFSEELTPGSDGNIRITGLAQLIADYLETIAPGTFAYTITAGSETKQSGNIIYYRHRATQFVGENLNRYFLTLATNEMKTIPADAEETLYFVPTADEQTNGAVATLDILWFNTYTMECVKTTTTLEAATYADGIKRLTLQPNKLTPPTTAHRLVSINLTLGMRRIAYLMQADTANGAPYTCLRFRNAFNVWDTFYFYGAVATTYKPTVNAASFGGRYKNYNIKHEPTYTAHTGEMGRATANLFRDLMTAKEIRRLATSDDNLTPRYETEVTITECDYKPSTAYASSGTGTLTWREAQTGLNLSPTMPVRTFDLTFDNTFE